MHAVNPPAQRNDRGIALVIVLAFVVLLTGMVVAYFSRSMTDRQLSNSSFNQAKADELARSALDILTSNLKQEIANGSTAKTANGVTLYVPTGNTAMVPVKNTPTTPIATLVRISTPNAIASPGVDQAAAPALSTVASANGRSIPSARWNQHYLLPLKNTATPADTTPVASFTAPSWVYVTSQGPQTLSAPSKTAIGRYAYAIYNEGALLDVNVAGYPADASTTSPPVSYAAKGSLAFADLTKVTSTTGATLITQAGVNNLVGWRNYASLRNAISQPTGAFPAFSFSGGTTLANAYKTLIISGSNAAIHGGFLKVSGTAANGRTDQTFLTRQELIDFCLATGTANFNPNALQYLGTFSRALNAPSWSPALDGTNGFTYKTNADTATMTVSGTAVPNPNRNLPNVRITKAFSRNDGTTAQVGEPLLKQRFPLSRLALVTDTTTAATGSDIEKYFGLTRSASGAEPWLYRNGATAILTLDQVAAAGREPDFFEMLKAAILAGSLGKSSNADYSTVSKTIDKSADAQIIQIGANLIDQYDSDNCPAAIAFGTFDPIYGIENLPYIDQIYTPIFRPNRGDPKYPTLQGWLQFQLWNPHQNAAGNTASTQFRVAAIDGKTYIECSNGANYYSPIVSLAGQYLQFGATGTTFSEPRLLVPNPANTGTSSTFGGVGVESVNGSTNYTSLTENYFGTTAQPSAATFTSATGSTPASSSVTVSSPCYLVGFPIGTVTVKDNLITKVSTDPATLQYYHARTQAGDGGKYATFQLQFQDANGNWRPYQTVQLSGIYRDFWFQYGYKSAACWLTGVGNLNNGIIGNSTTVGSGLAFGRNAFNSIDPRSKRGGMGSQYGLNNQPVIANSTTRPNTWANRFDTDVQANGGFATNPPGYTIWHWWSGNNTFQPACIQNNTTSQTSYMTDLDGVTRRGDGDEAHNVLPTAQGWNSIGKASRPVILNRPFQSVGEMGYCMRGDPWKSLNLFSADSADAALMDVFSVDDAPVVAGRVSLNTPHNKVIQAILNGVAKVDDGSALPPSTLVLSEAQTIATKIVQISGSAPLVNVSELATRVGDSIAASFAYNADAAYSYSDGYTKTRREAAVRALASVGDTRTWNLLIDVIAQTGIFQPTAPSTQAALNNAFIVQGERRYWLHIAIDRYTGEIVGQQLETVYE